MSYLNRIRGDRALKRALQKAYREGRDIPFKDIERIYGVISSLNPEIPLQLPLPLEDLDSVNLQLAAITEDHNVLFKSAGVHMNRIIERVVSAETIRKAASSRVRQLDSLLNRLALLKSDTSFVDVLTFNITDPAYINIPNSDVGIDRDSNQVTLRPTKAGTRRWNLSTNQTIQSITSRDGMVFAPVLGSDVKAIFDDTYTFWAQQGQTKTSGPADISVTIPVSSSDFGALPVNRISGKFLSVGSVSIQVSVDGQNWFQVGSSQKVGPVNTWLFPGKEILFIRVVFHKSDYDAENRGTYLYNFGIESLALFTTGYELENTYETKALEVSGGAPITSVALEADYEMPEGTTINFEVSPDGTVYFPIRPTNLGQGEATSAPRLVTFRNSMKESVVLDVFEDSTYSYKGVTGASDDFALYSDSLSRTQEVDAAGAHADYSDNVKSHSMRTWRLNAAGLPFSVGDNIHNPRLWKGVNGWKRSPLIQEISTTVNNLYVELTPGQSTPLFRTITQTIPVSSSGTTQLKMTNSILSGSNINLKPPTSVSAEFAGNVFASVLNVRHEKNTTNITATYRVYEQDEKDIDGTRGKIVGVFETSGDTAFASSVTPEMVLRVQGVGTIRASILDIDGPIDQYKTAYVYENDLVRAGITPIPGLEYQILVGSDDITQEVTSVSGNVITLNNSIVGGVVKVTYNTPLLPTEKVVASSVNIISTTGQEFSSGLDYTIVGSQIVVPRNSRIGSIQSGSVYLVPVRISYTITGEVSGLETYTTWVRVGGSQPVTFEYSALEIDTDQGESVTLFGESETIDVPAAAKLELKPGWYKLTVLSKPFERISMTATSTMFYNLVKLKGINGNYFMNIFAEQFATEYASVPVGKFELARSISQYDDNVFTLDSDKNLYLNHHPSSDTRYVSFSPLEMETLDPSAPPVPRISYRLEYDRMVVGDGLPQDVNSIIIRAVLRRTSSTDGGISPVIKNLRLKVV